MSALTPGSGGGSTITIANASVSQPTTAELAVLANVEANYMIPLDTKRFRLQFRGGARLKLAYAAAALEWTELPYGCFLEETQLGGAVLTLYLTSTRAGTIEIVSWV